MPGANDIRAGGAYVDIRTDQKDYDKGLQSAKAKLQRFADEVKKVGLALSGLSAALIAPITKAINTYTEFGDSLDKIGTKLGILPEKLNAIRYAGGINGIDERTIDMALQRMVRRAGQAAEGTGEAVDALKKLNIEAKMFSNLSPDEQLKLIADRLATVENHGQKMVIMFKMFDSEGVSMINLLKNGSGYLDQMEERLKLLGATIGTDGVSKAVKLKDAITELLLAVKGLELFVSSKLIVRVTEWVQTLTALLIATREYIDANPELINAFTQMGKWLLILTAFTMGLATAMILLMTGLAPVYLIIAGFLALHDALGLVDTGLGTVFRHIKVGSNSVMGHIEGLGDWAVAHLTRFWDHFRGIWGDMVNLVAISTVKMTQLWSKFMNWLGVISDEEYASIKEAAEESVKLLWQERVDDAAAAENKFKTLMDARSERLAYDAAMPGAFSTIQNRMNEVLDNLRNIETPKFTAPDIGGGFGLPKTGVIGFFGGLRAAEFSGMANDVPSRQLNVMEKMDSKLEKIVAQTKDMQPVYQ